MWPALPPKSTLTKNFQSSVAFSVSIAELVDRRKTPSPQGLWFQVGLILFKEFNSPVGNACSTLDTGPFLDSGIVHLSMCRSVYRENFCLQKFKVRKGVTAALEEASRYGSYSFNDLTMVHPHRESNRPQSHV